MTSTESLEALFEKRWRTEIMHSLKDKDVNRYAVVVFEDHVDLYPNFLAAEFACVRALRTGKMAIALPLIKRPICSYEGKIGII